MSRYSRNNYKYASHYSFPVQFKKIQDTPSPFKQILNYINKEIAIASDNNISEIKISLNHIQYKDHHLDRLISIYNNQFCKMRIEENYIHLSWTNNVHN